MTPRRPAFRLLAALGLAVVGCGGTRPAPDTAALDAALDAVLDAVLDVGAAPEADAPEADASAPAPRRPMDRHTRSIVTSADGARVYVVNADSDSLSVIDARTRTLVREVPLGSAPPSVDAATGRFDPRVGPRTLALAHASGLLYVAAQRSNEVLVVDPNAGAVLRRAAVGSEPFGVLLDPSEGAVYVSCSQDDAVLRLDARTLAVTGRVAAPLRPWALAQSDDGRALWVTHFLFAGRGERPREAGVSELDPQTLAVRRTVTLADVPARSDRRLANGAARGLYDASPRPGTADLWVPHLLLSQETAQTPANAPTPRPNELRFDTSVFPAVAVLDGAGTFTARYAPSDGNSGDVTSGPRAIEFSPDGRYAFVLDAQSEDIMLVDTQNPRAAEAFPALPGNLPEGLAVSPDGRTLYVDERNTHDVAFVRFDPSGETRLRQDGPPVERLVRDPMPARMRLGQNVFYTANDREIPVTQNHWVACASCHLEGRSDGVTWRFAPGPRDTPSNAGGTLGTGFLLHTAGRRGVAEYAHTVVEEQGGAQFAHEDNPDVRRWLEALEDYVNRAIPPVLPPATDAARVARGREVFNRPSVGCASCHGGPRLTDSGDGNPSLALDGPVLLHDVGTCNRGPFPDVEHRDVGGRPRAACAFDTPSLLGVADSPPYFHDGSALTLREALEQTRGRMGDIRALREDELGDLLEYLRSL